MKLAISTWNKRIAPVFDTAENVLLLTINDDDSINRESLNFPEYPLQKKVDFLKEKDIKVLICGAISKDEENSVIGKGIEVYSFIAGDIEEIIRGWQDGCLYNGRFFMPGCGCSRRQYRKRNRYGRKI
jgi:predicted Fe-Mo cluster-binding NifX family protein